MCEKPEKRPKIFVESKGAEKENMPCRTPSVKFVGAHVSAAGGLWRCFENANRIGCQSFALFLKNQRKWVSPELTKSDIDRFQKEGQKYNYSMDKILPHGSYLINLGNPDPEKRQKSYEAFLDDIKRCEALGLCLYNFHPGSTVGKCSVGESIKHIAKAINEAHKNSSGVCIVLETMAGQGNTIGNRFEELRDIIALVEDKTRVGVCIDTCHIFAAGYDIRTPKSFAKTMDQFENIVGFKYLKSVHLNDSKTDLGSGKDRHENLGAGKIGLEAFRALMNDVRFHKVPLVLETPTSEGTDGDRVYEKEIKLLYDMIQATD